MTVERDGRIAVVTLDRPPNNLLDLDLVSELAATLEGLGDDCRAVVLAANGKHFCAGMDVARAPDRRDVPRNPLYEQAVRIFRAPVPIVAAVQGAAIGGGLGLALVADIRVACTTTRMAANFARLGIHPGFGMSVTLPAIVGQQRALELLYTGRSVTGDELGAIGLADRVVEPDALLDSALAFAEEIAGSAPLAVRAIRATQRRAVAEQLATATLQEHTAQQQLFPTADAAEGMLAARERRPPTFVGR